MELAERLSASGDTLDALLTCLTDEQRASIRAATPALQALAGLTAADAAAAQQRGANRG